MLVITPLYLGLAGLLYLGLVYRVIRLRYAQRIGVGTGDKWLQRRIRAHANFAEYAPLALLLLVAAELQGMPALVLHGFGSALFLGRAVHAFGISQEPERLIFRQVGMVLTLLVIALLAVGVIAYAVF